MQNNTYTIDEIRLAFCQAIAHLDNLTTTDSYPTNDGGMDMKKYARVNIGIDQSGKKIYKQIQASSQDDLNDKIVLAYISSGRIYEFLPPDRKQEEKHSQITFREYTQNWMKSYKIDKVKPTTVAGYNTMLNSHFYPAFGDTIFQSITTGDFQAFLDARSNLSKKYLSDMKKFFGMICRDAIEDNVITSNPTESRRIIIPSDKKTVRQALSEQDFADIAANIDKLPDLQRTMLALMMFTGMRRGEVLGLKWGDIDFEQGIIHVQRNVTYAKNQPTIGTTKTQSGNRSIVLVQHLKKYLHPRQDNMFVIGGESPISYMSFKLRWKKIANLIDLHGATPHIFRHTFLTFLVGSGTDIKTVQAIAGHSDIQVTMNRYVHSQEKNIYAAGELFQKSVCWKNCQVS